MRREKRQQKNKVQPYALLAILTLLLPSYAFAQESGTISLSVSPTIFEMQASPEQVWPSTVRVINPNQFPLTIYATPVQFEPAGEGGGSTFTTIRELPDPAATLAGWITLGIDEVTIPPEQTAEVPFTINVPNDAPPGGHFAAILIGTRNLDEADAAAQVETAQVVTALVLLRVEGEVVEQASIRSFRATDGVVPRPKVNFELRVENSGNVHVQPQGEIKIYNMWGTERGVIPVNRTLLFGNVLPDSIRKYTFDWTGQWSLADIGRYRVEATVAYGDTGRKFMSSETHFWIIPFRELFILVTGVAGMIWLIAWGIKLYIRRMLTLSGVTPSAAPVRKVSRQRVSIVAPIESSILDLRNRLSQETSWLAHAKTCLSFAMYHKIFITAVVGAIVLVCGVWWFVSTITSNDQAYAVTVNNGQTTATTNSEQRIYEELRATTQEEELPTDQTLPAITIHNRSGQAGKAAKMRLLLEQSGYSVTSLETDPTTQAKRTVIVFESTAQSQAIALSKTLEGSLLSAAPIEESLASPIIIYVGEK